MFGWVCWAWGWASLKEFGPVSLRISAVPVGKCIPPENAHGTSSLTGTVVEIFPSQCSSLTSSSHFLPHLSPPLHSNISFPSPPFSVCLSSSCTYIPPFYLFSSPSHDFHPVLSSRCSQHTLEADSVLLGGLLNCQERRGDLWQYCCQAQWEECGKRHQRATLNSRWFIFKQWWRKYSVVCN